MKKNIIISLLFVGIAIFSCSKNNNTEINKNIFNTDSYVQMNNNSKKLFLDSLYKFSNEISDTPKSINFLFKLAEEYYYLNEYEKSLYISRKIFFKTKKLQDTLSIAKAYYYIGDAFEQEHKDSAYYYYQKAEKLYQLVNNSELRGKMLFNKGYILFYEGNYTESEIEFSQSLQFLKYSSNHELLYTVYNMMGCVLERLEDYDQSLKYFGSARDQLKLMDDESNKDFNYNLTLSINIANLYDKRKEYKKSIKELSSILNYTIERKMPNDYANVIGNLGYSKMKNGELDGVENLLLKALNLSLKSGTQTNTFYKYINLGEYYLKVKDTTKSRDFLKRALVLGKKIKVSNELKLVYNLLSKSEPQRDSYYKGKIIRLSDSLAVVQRKNRNKYARIEYETSVVEDANKELTSRNLYLIVGVVVLAGALAIRYVMGQRKEIAYRKQLQAAEQELFDLMQTYQIELNGARLEEQNRISRELHDNVMNRLYGTRLQLGMLNSIKNIEAEEKRLEQINSLQAIEHDIRAISHDLHNDDVASHFNFAVLLAQCVQQVSTTTTTSLHFESTPEIDWESISGLVKITIYRIVQEALTNVTKYASATECHITITQPDASKLLLRISDTGKGFDLAQISTGIGLKNMRERARLVKAELNIQSTIEQGTRIECLFMI